MTIASEINQTTKRINQDDLSEELNVYYQGYRDALKFAQSEMEAELKKQETKQRIKAVNFVKDCSGGIPFENNHLRCEGCKAIIEFFEITKEEFEVKQ